MKFDLFHSIGRIDTLSPRLSDRQVFQHFFSQAKAAEDFGFELVWVAESHFSSELQRTQPNPVIPNYRGEVGLNADGFQVAQKLFASTKKIGFGTAILNIVGGNGGPIAAADRVRTFSWLNSLSETPRQLHIGFASGRFPYINRPFGIVPRTPCEEVLWREVQRLILLEASEIFIRLLRGEALGSRDLSSLVIDASCFANADSYRQARDAIGKLSPELLTDQGITYQQRWQFDPIKLVPAPDAAEVLPRLVLGSSDQKTLDHVFRLHDCDLFNLSFTPPDAIERTHIDMQRRSESFGRVWQRHRMPRTVLIFIDKNSDKAHARASAAIDTYIEAMRGTVMTPPKEVLLARALIGSPAEICEQLSPGHSKGFHPHDRLMLWFEFNQSNHDDIVAGMRLFAEEVMPIHAGDHS